MYQIDHFELTSPHCVALALGRGCVIRANSGRLWLTLQGHTEDIWLQAGQHHTLAANATVWISAEPRAQFQVARALSSWHRPGWAWPRVRAYLRPHESRSYFPVW
jgi:hypothetical protein